MYRIENQIHPLSILSLICSLCLLGATANADNVADGIADLHAEHPSTLNADTVWHSEVEQLDWSNVKPALDSDAATKSWVDGNYESDADQVVVKGVAGSQPALRRAINEYILPRVEEQTRIGSVWDRQLARRRVDRELERLNIVSDSFSQTFYRRVGDDEIEVFTREALLLDLSEANMEPIVRGVRHDLHRSKRVRSEAFGFVGIVMSVACIVCWIVSRFLNRVTRGYYVWPIRLVTGLAFLSCLGLTAGIAFSFLRAI